MAAQALDCEQVDPNHAQGERGKHDASALVGALFFGKKIGTRCAIFDWNYFGFHAWYMVYANAYAFADGPNGRTYVSLYPRNYGDVWRNSPRGRRRGQRHRRMHT